MGYTTDFEGTFKIDPPLTGDALALCRGLATTRRMKRNLEGYGVDGEFYVGDTESFGQSRTDDILDYNKPPSTQPGLWCQWEVSEDGATMEWDGNEKFYDYVEWLEYLISKVIEPAGSIVSGTVHWSGEEVRDHGLIDVTDNKVSVDRD